MCNQIKNQPTACEYLFGKRAEEIFNTKRYSAESVNHSLETMMRVHVYILSKEGGIVILDPAAFNNQCELYALEAARIKKNYHKKTGEEKLARTEENRYIQLNCFLSYFTDTTQVRCEMMSKMMKEAKIDSPKPEKTFTLFVKDPEGQRKRAARLALNQVFENVLKTMLFSSKETAPIYRELYELSQEDLQLKAFKGKGMLFAYPMLASTVYFTNAFAKEKIPFVFKIKIMTKEGTGTLSYVSNSTFSSLIPLAQLKDSEKPNPDEPAVVFEAISTDGSLTEQKIDVDALYETAKPCPRNLDRHPSSTKRHAENTTCFFCNSQKLDLKPFKEKAERAMTSFTEMFYALGADYVKEQQKAFEPFFYQKKKYPLLTDIYQKSVPKIDQLKLSMYKPEAFSIVHVQIDIVKYAYRNEMLMNDCPEAHLKGRGIL